MFHRTWTRYLAAASALALLSACVENPLDVKNKNNPDVDRVYASPANVETAASQSFKNMYNGQYAASDALWVRPEIVGEVEFANWTPDGVLRHARWRGLRPDKSADEISVEA